MVKFFLNTILTNRFVKRRTSYLPSLLIHLHKKNISLLHALAAGQGLGQESLTIIVHFVPILVSAHDPGGSNSLPDCLLPPFSSLSRELKTTKIPSLKLGIFVVAGRLELEPYTAKPSLTVLLYFQNQFQSGSGAKN